MTDKELRELRDANRDDEVMVGIINRLILCRRNLAQMTHPERRATVQAAIDRLEARVTGWKHQALH